MRWLLGWLVLVGASVSAPAADPPWKEARTRWLHGNYAEARAAFEALIKGDRPPSAAVIGLSRTLQSTGQYGQCLGVIETALKRTPNDPDLLARQAEVLYLRGRWDEAEKAADAAMAKKSDHFLARWIKGQILRDRGELEKADEAFRWFVRTYSQRSKEDNDIKDAEELALVGRAGVENANAHSLTDQFSFILNDLYGDALKEDKDYWIVEVQAGELLLDKYNRGEAYAAFDKALKINPRAAEALVGKARASLQQFEVKDADQFTDQALKINPRLPSALRLKADLNILAGDLPAARKHLNDALAINPRDEHTLGRIAAIFAIQRRHDEVARLAKEVLGFDAKPGVFYTELGEQLEGRRLFRQAEQYYQQAVALRPNMPGARNNLGLLYMRMGREADARKALDAAFDADRFNVRVANSRKVLKHLENYKTLETAHFEIRYDPKNDAVLSRFVADYLEQLYENYSKQFDYAPKGPILVEVFNNHEMFSGRTVALPDLHTVGACTGKMFAMVSPKGRGIRKPFNWGRVLRHELVHIFNLEQTDMQVPHWLTEGIAVANEGFPRPPQWHQILTERAAKNKLLTLDNITLAFVRPADPLEWSLAYCQSNLYVEFLIKDFGAKSIGALLAAYAEGLDDAGALRKVCGLDKAEFEKRYQAFVKDLVKSMKVGAPVEKPQTLSQLQSEHEKKPDDVDIAAKLAERLVARDPGKARKLAEAVLEKQKEHSRAAVVIARLDAKAGRTDDAIKALEGVLKKEKPDVHLLLALGRLYAEAGRNVEASEILEQGRKLDPYDPTWLEELAKLYKKGDDRAKRISVLLDLVATDADEFEQRKLLAQLLLDEGRNAEAEKVARDALEINLLDEETQEILVKALKAQKKDDEAAKLKKLLQD